MRPKRLLVAALAVGIAASVSGVAIGAPAVQTIDVQVGGKAKPKLDRKKFKKTSIEVETTVHDQANPDGIPPKANRALINFDRKNVKFKPNAAQGCDPAQIENTTTETAKGVCGASVVGKGSAIAALPFGPGGARQDFPAAVTAFNDATQRGLLLHSRVDSLGTTVVLKGELQGKTLDVAIPPLGGGVGAIAQFEAKVKKGKYVQARCKGKKFKTTSEWSYNDAPNATATDKQKCKRKKKRR